jgi:hypothetical protein
MPNQCQISKPKLQKVFKKRTKFKFWILPFELNLTFACLPVGRDFEIWISLLLVREAGAYQ